ncbi:MAG: hypothetical protein IPJ69_07550 [Deltaproteobacteria bacterium]|nr:MAG: hypothetical protein IPJ69_07550 [Deltaproteobacteria bacterium]
MKVLTKPSKIPLVRMTAWIAPKKLKILIKEYGSRHSQSEILRALIDQELERITSFKAHQDMYGIASKDDFQG